MENFFLKKKKERKKEKKNKTKHYMPAWTET